MVTLSSAFLTFLPLYPLNPSVQDTAPPVVLQFSAGIVSPNEALSPSIDISSKFEFSPVHPFIFRGSVDYRFGSVITHLYPGGDLHSLSLAVEGMYYRGTNRLTGFFGGGVVVTGNFFALDRFEADSLLTYERIDRVTMTSALGYRLVAGIRFDRSVSLELTVGESRPMYRYREREEANRFSVRREELRFNEMRLSCGYLLPLRR